MKPKPVRRQKKQTTSNVLFLGLNVLFLSALPVLGAFQLALKTANLLPLFLYPMMSVITFALYANDKARAKQNQWRIPENSLHLVELMGGWLGGYIAQRVIRHKNKKISYQLVFWAIVVLHLALWLDWFVSGGTLTELLFNGIFQK
ncbi:DUF1294 domain-containing protein [Chroococcus sp. FPU101]|uniref:DUF1294 domain-containing protein n=1 Tax=Chroococcus sp. FPU101 TaxID=1974212 RepID=UPI001A8D9C94|nr:DUF1294 domain-containing protein [Chroococcus sp. FPU101]GFE69875.1 hypothetical protein CFPU101_24850 [Chroococcus sp. FPU101]